LGFVGYQYLLSPRVKRASGKYNAANLASQQTKGGYDVDWIPKHHLVQRSPKKSPRKSRQTNEVNGTGAASSENDE